MPHWDRLALLELVDKAKNRLQEASISDAQRHQLQDLVELYAKKTQSITANREDVHALEAQLLQIFIPHHSND